MEKIIATFNDDACGLGGVLFCRSCVGNVQAQNVGGDVQWYWIGAEGCVCVSGRLVIVPWRSAELISIVLLMQ